MMQRRKRKGKSPARAARVRVSTTARAATTPSRTVRPGPGRARTSTVPRQLRRKIADQTWGETTFALARASGPTPRRQHGARRRRGGRLRHLPPRAVVGAAGKPCRDDLPPVRAPKPEPTRPGRRWRALAPRPSPPAVFPRAHQPGGFSLARARTVLLRARRQVHDRRVGILRHPPLAPWSVARMDRAESQPHLPGRLRTQGGRISAASRAHLGRVSDTSRPYLGRACAGGRSRRGLPPARIH